MVDSALRVLGQFMPGAFMRFWEPGVQVRQLVLSSAVPATRAFHPRPTPSDHSRSTFPQTGKGAANRRTRLRCRCSYADGAARPPVAERRWKLVDRDPFYFDAPSAEEEKNGWSPNERYKWLAIERHMALRKNIARETEPDGATNGTQPIRAGTNLTPPTAGSRR